jgi:hypothetical protein
MGPLRLAQPVTANVASNRAHVDHHRGLPATPGQLQQDTDQAITSTIDSHVQAEQRGHPGDGQAGVRSPPWANGR